MSAAAAPVGTAAGARGAEARERILAAAVRQFATEGFDGVRIARVAMSAGVSPALVHYHFATREALLAQALDYSYMHAGDPRISTREIEAGSHWERLELMIAQCLPTSESLTEDWHLWVELWRAATRDRALAPVAESLYARMRAWFVDEIDAGIRDGEFQISDAAALADMLLALIDGYGIRALIGDRAMTIDRARAAIGAALARGLK